MTVVQHVENEVAKAFTKLKTFETNSAELIGEVQLKEHFVGVVELCDRNAVGHIVPSCVLQDPAASVLECVNVRM